MRDENAGELPVPGVHLVADDEVAIAVGHHAEAFGHIDENNVVGHVRARLGRGRAAHQRRRVHHTVAGGAMHRRIRRAACRTEAAMKILPGAAARAALIDDRRLTGGPARALLHRTRSRNMLTWDDSTPPSPCSSATDASRTWRAPARPVICRWVSTRCAIAPATPQWP